MNDIKIPLILLLCVICGAGFYFLTSSKKPAKTKVKPKTQVVKDIVEEKKDAETDEAEVLKSAKKAFEASDYQKTLDLLANFTNSNNYEINRLIAYSLSFLNEYDRAILAFEKTLKIRKVPIDGYNLGYMYELTGRFNAAKALYLELAELELPDNLKKNLYEGIARISIYLPENKLFNKYTEELVKNNPDSKDGVIALIKQKKQSESFTSIEELAEKEDKYFEKDYSYNYEMAQLFEVAGKNDKAVSYYKKCIRLDKENYTPFFDCYRVLMKINKTDPAIKALEYFLESEQVYPTTFFDAAKLAHKNKRYKQAFRFYLTAVVSDSRLLGKDDNGLVRDVENYFREKGTETEKVFVNAFVCYLNGDYNYAISEMKRIKNEIENSIYKNDCKLVLEASERLANIDKKREDEQKAYEKAYDNYLKAKDEAEKRRLELANRKTTSIESKRSLDNELKTKALKNINNYDVQMEVAQEFLSKGNTKEAKIYFKNATNLNNSSFEPFYELAKIALKENNNEEAQKYIDEALKINSSDSDLLSCAASIYLNINVDKAKEYAESAVFNSPNNSSAKILLAKVYIKKQEFRKADEIINDALSKEKDKTMRDELQKLKRQF